MSSAAIDVAPWTKTVLKLAAAYNLLWGSFTLFFPQLPFAWAGLPLPNYLPIWQCLGMVIGVYGVGYAIAATNPARHWPIVLVGLLGKIFGPIGFLFYASLGELPWSLGWMILANDLIWWLPFAAILFQAIRVNDFHRLQLTVKDLQAELQHAVSQQGASLLELSEQSKVLTVFLRHAGCTYCREMLTQVQARQAEFRREGYQIAIVHMSSPADGARLAKKYDLESAHWFSDPTRRLYHACDLRLGTLNELLGPAVFWRAFVTGVIFRHGFGPMQGNGLQLSGALVLHHGRIVQGVRHQSTAEATSWEEVCSL